MANDLQDDDLSYRVHTTLLWFHHLPTYKLFESFIVKKEKKIKEEHFKHTNVNVLRAVQLSLFNLWTTFWLPLYIIFENFLLRFEMLNVVWWNKMKRSNWKQRIKKNKKTTK